MNGTLAAARQVLSLGRESFGIARSHGIARGFYWFMVRNTVSLRQDVNNSRKSRFGSAGHSLAADGFAELTPLSAGLSDRLVAHFLSKSNTDGRTDSLQAYFDHWRSTGIVRPAGVSLTQEADLLREVFRETGLLEIVEEHLGLRRDKMVVNAVIDTLVKLDTTRKLVNGYDDALEIHRDIDSFKFVKVFFYLNDIAEGHGHHEVYLGTHRGLPLPLRLLKRYSESDLRAHQVPVRLKKVVGPKGYGFIENTTTFHRGTVPSAGDRIMLSMSFNDAASVNHLYDSGYHPLPAAGGS